MATVASDSDVLSVPSCGQVVVIVSTLVWTLLCVDAADSITIKWRPLLCGQVIVIVIVSTLVWTSQPLA